MKYKVFYGCEENAFEVDNLGEFNSIEEAIECVKDSIHSDFIEDEAELAEQIINDVDENGIDFRNTWGYVVAYKIATNKKDANRFFNEIRREIFY